MRNEYGRVFEENVASLFLWQEKLSSFEQLETDKNKQISALKQEIESLKNQLEYVSHLLKSVERGEGEGQGETPPQQVTGRQMSHFTFFASIFFFK